MSSSVAASSTRLNQLIAEIRRQSPKTLAFWRLSHSNLVEALQEFAAGDDDDQNDNNELLLLDQVQALFRDQINPLLAQQENSTKGFLFSEEQSNNNNNNYNNGSAAAADYAKQEVSVVFGGKYSKNPASISEFLVSKLIEQSPQVITVSRSMMITGDDDASLPKNLTHVAKQNLDAAEGGVPEFVDVMNLAKESFQNSNNADDDENNTTRRIAFYLTLGQHKGANPFVRNLQAAQNFCQALQQTMDSSSPQQQQQQQQHPSWRVILTGTDATLPSTHPDGNVCIVLDEDGHQEDLVVPSYKIMQYNYVYAMSKLGQYYMVVHAVATLLGRKEIVEETAPVIDKIRQHVYKAKEDGDYHAESSSSTSSSITMAELDEISRRIIELADQVSDHVWIATGISICYTPLHAKPWTAAGLKTESPRGHVVEQIVRRLKNAISIEKAAARHFPPQITTSKTS
jgi:hypothetical protein